MEHDFSLESKEIIAIEAHTLDLIDPNIIRNDFLHNGVDALLQLPNVLERGLIIQSRVERGVESIRHEVLEASRKVFIKHTAERRRGVGGGHEVIDVPRLRRADSVLRPSLVSDVPELSFSIESVEDIFSLDDLVIKHHLQRQSVRGR